MHSFPAGDLTTYPTITENRPTIDRPEPTRLTGLAELGPGRREPLHIVIDTGDASLDEAVDRIVAASEANRP